MHRLIHVNLLYEWIYEAYLGMGTTIFVGMLLVCVMHLHNV